MSAITLSDILSVPAMEEELNGNFEGPLDFNTIDLTGLAFSKGKDPMLCPKLCNIGLLQDTWKPTSLLPPPTPSDVVPSISGLFSDAWVPEVPSLSSQNSVVSEADNGYDSSFSAEDSIGSEDSVDFSDALSPPSPPSALKPSPDKTKKEKEKATPSQKKAKQGVKRSRNSGTTGAKVKVAKREQQKPGIVSTDDLSDMDDDMIMSPAQEAELRSLLAKKQKDLEMCTGKMKGLTPQNKKRLRNRHASCVSRLKKKLYICNLQRDLERTRNVVTQMEETNNSQEEIIQQLQAENKRLRYAARAQSPSLEVPSE